MEAAGATDYSDEFPRHLLSSNQLKIGQIKRAVCLAAYFRAVVKSEGGCNRLRGKVMGTFFLEPSTRTSVSFQVAMQRLGGTVVNVSKSEKSSSLEKGETDWDTVKTLSKYCDCLVIRHNTAGGVEALSQAASCPVINAGDGTGEHPTQSLVDIFTIINEYQRIGQMVFSADLASCRFNPNLPSMRVAFVGDLKNGRTVHSLIKMLALFPNVEFDLIAPVSLQLPTSILEEISSSVLTVTSDLLEVIGFCDVLYMTRIQKERFSDEDEYLTYKEMFKINKSVMKMAKDTMILLHPLPRVCEIDVEVDDDHRAAYFRQVENGLYIRMAILSALITT